MRAINIDVIDLETSFGLRFGTIATISCEM